MVSSAYLGHLGVSDSPQILTHSFSRVVTQALLHAHARKRISVYVTEARPRGLGCADFLFRPRCYPLFNSLKTYEILTAVGIPCTVVLDSAVAYVMDKVDFVLVGSEAVVESGGLINALGSNQMAIIAKAQNKPFYALAERWFPRIVTLHDELTEAISYKFHRSFPLSQYDLPTHNSRILSFAQPTKRAATEQIQVSAQVTDVLDRTTASDEHVPISALLSVASPQRTMTSEQISRNPDVDYTTFELVPLLSFPQSDRRPQTRLDISCLFRRRCFDTGGSEPILSWDVRGFMTAISDDVVVACSSHDQYNFRLILWELALKLSYQNLNFETCRALSSPYAPNMHKSPLRRVSPHEGPLLTFTRARRCMVQPMLGASVAYLC